METVGEMQVQQELWQYEFMWVFICYSTDLPLSPRGIWVNHQLQEELHMYTCTYSVE